MTITANAQGQLVGQFQIPASIPAGTKLIEFRGSESEAFASFTGRGTLKTEDLRAINTTIHRRVLTWKGDPLAQTFIIPPDTDSSQVQIAAVDLWFPDVGTTNILVQIRDVNLGIPTLDVIAECLKTPAEVTEGAWTRFKFKPTLLDRDHEYAIVIACNDAVTSVATAGIGEFDDAAQVWVTSQPYQIGVLLSSSNNRTWTAHQSRDLTFRMLACDYNYETNVILDGATSKEVELEPQTVTDADHLMVLAAVDRPTTDCEVVFRLTMGETVHEVIEGQSFTLPARYTGEVGMTAILTGTFYDSPVLYRDIALVAGKRLTTGDYVTRAMQTNIGLSANVKLTAYYDLLLAGNSSVAAYYESAADTWTTLPLIVGTELGDGWVEIKREVSGLTLTETRIKLVLTGSGINMPRVRNLRVAIT